jgi:helix-turn-helix, Psq domain
MEHNIQLALDDLYVSRFTSIRAAARTYNVNYRTLTRRAQGGILKREVRVQ